MTEITENALEPAYDFWVAKDFWPHLVAAGVIGGLDPDHIKYNPHSNGYVHYEVPRGKELVLGLIEIFETWFAHPIDPFTWVDKALKNGTPIPKKLWLSIKKKFTRNCEYDQELAIRCPAITKKLNTSSVKKTKKSDDEITDTSPASVDDKAIPPYMDENHPNFAPELKIAVDAWIALLSDPCQAPLKKGIQPTLEAWMKKTNIALKGQATLERISSVITPEIRKKKGGAISTDK